MPRTARLRIPGYPLHVVQRGHNRDACFFEASNYQLYSGLLAEFAARESCEIHAFVLMPNHVHLLLTERQPSAVTGLMRAVNQRYVQAINRRYKRTGSLWQGRFHSSIVQSDQYLLACQRYIELNPVRAAMVANPAEYPWSSHRHNAWEEHCSFLEPHETYLALGPSRDAVRKAYRHLFDEPMPEAKILAIREAINTNLPYGSERFLSDIATVLKRPLKPAMQGQPWPASQTHSKEGPSPIR